MRGTAEVLFSKREGKAKALFCSTGERDLSHADPGHAT
jgi:hypothetical protein